MDLAEMRQINRKAIFDIVRTKREVTRAELQKLTGFSGPFIMEIANDFIEKRILILTGTKTGAVGRRPYTMVFNPDVFLSIGIELAGKYIYAGIVNLDGHVAYQTRQVIKDDDDFSAIQKCIDRLIRTGELVGLKCNAIGIGLPGSVEEDERGTYSIRSSWDGMIQKTYVSDMLNTIRERYHIPVYFENDVNARAIGEYYLLQMDNNAPKDLMFIAYTEFGIGAGLVLDGKLRKGQHNLAGAFGQMVSSSDEWNQRFYKGALENKISRETIREKFGVEIEAGEVTEEAVDYISSEISPFISNIINALDFDHVALGGGLCDACGDLLIERTREKVRKQTLCEAYIEKTQTEFSGVVGSALMASNYLCDLVL